MYSNDKNETTNSNRPNVIIVVPHDTRTSYGCYGLDDVRTPNIDKIANEEALFENNF